MRNQRHAALSAGDKTYTTGVPCSKGHLAPRKANNGGCTACENLRKRRKYATAPAAEKARSQAYRNVNRELVNASAREYYAENTVGLKLKSQDYYQANRALCLAKNKIYHAKNRGIYRENYFLDRDRLLEQGRVYRRNNPHVSAAAVARRRARKLKATPCWVDHVTLNAFYKMAKELQKHTGEKMQVDHIIPLQGNGVCGLHVPWNLQVLTEQENKEKAARYDGSFVVFDTHFGE